MISDSFIVSDFLEDSDICLLSQRKYYLKVKKGTSRAICFSHIKDEVIEESIRQYYQFVDTLYDVKNFAVDKLCYFPKYMLRKMKEHLRDLFIFDPISPNFNFAALSVYGIFQLIYCST